MLALNTNNNKKKVKNKPKAKFGRDDLEALRTAKLDTPGEILDSARSQIGAFPMDFGHIGSGYGIRSHVDYSENRKPEKKSPISKWNTYTKEYDAQFGPLQLEIHFPITVNSGLKRMTQTQVNRLLNRCRELSDDEFQFTFSMGTDFVELIPDEVKKEDGSKKKKV